jgi:hypothetical protein
MDKSKLSSKGLQFILHCKPKIWIETLAIEVETATGHAYKSQQNYLRYSAAKISRDSKTRMKNKLYQEENIRTQQ